MKSTELRNWTIQACKSDTAEDSAVILKTASECVGDRIASDVTMQVHDILMKQGVISDEVVENGRSGDCKWVSETDWIYRCGFGMPEHGGRKFLHFYGLDTVCDLYLNGNHLGTSRSMYLPFRVEVTGLLEANNELLVYFHRHQKMLDHYEATMPEHWRGEVPAHAMLMKSDDYGKREADGHGYSPIGIFNKVLLETVEHAELLESDIEIELNSRLDKADVTVSLGGSSYDSSSITAEIAVAEENGSNPVCVKVSAESEEDVWTACARLHIDDPKLWWPKNYGDHPLYRASIRIFADGQLVEEVIKPFGIRKIRKTGDMVFEFNNVPVRFWGGNIAPIWGPSNQFNSKVAFDLIEKIDFANMNTIRIWGPNKPYPDEFYDIFDRLGIMVWQDFPTGGSQLPDSPEYKELILNEAEFMLRRLKHHASIFMWCGGNENIYMCELQEKKGTYGFDILTDDFRNLCAKLDPKRYYHTSCPAEGRYTNDPSFCDSHGSRALRAYCAGEQYGVFFSENIRVYPPQYKSMHRWLGDDIWEEGYIDYKPFGCVHPVPKSWKKLLKNNGEEKFGPIWDYYAAKSPRDLIYKFTAAAGQDIYQMYARSRRGNPAYKSYETPACRGHMMWKINDPWPNFYCAYVDYYGECSLTYYAAKRAMQPVMIDFEVSDHIYLWGVNDTRKECHGTLDIILYNMEQEKVKKTFSAPVALQPGSSKIIMDLDSFGFLHWFTLLYAQVRDENGNVILTTNAYLTRENMYPFHDARISVEYDQEYLTVRTDRFARCVELSCGEEGDEFGWVFEDNYFDLFPFEEKHIKILKRGKGATVLAKPQYSSYAAKITL
jgi:hypothetical protein